MKYFAFAAVLLLGACSANRTGVPVNYPDRSTAQEDLQIRASAQRSQALIAALQRKDNFGTGVQISVEPLFSPEQTTQVASGSYIRAFDDARAKAAGLAAHMGAHLSSARDITEMLGSEPRYGAAANAMPALRSVTIAAVRVSAAPNQPITLAVTFTLAGDATRTISVFGLSATQPSSASMNTAQGLRVDLTARGADISAAAAQLRQADAQVRGIARENGLPDSAFSVMRSNFGSY